LEWRREREEEQEDQLGGGVRHEVHHVAEEPREANGDGDGEVQTELLSLASLVGFLCVLKRLVDFTADIKEEDGVACDC